MDKFWLGVGSLLVLALVLLLTAQNGIFSQGSINFTDLETECRQGSQEVNVNLQGNRMVFSGHFPVEHPQAELDYRYRQTSDSVILDVLVDDVESQNRSFIDGCLASAVYDARTERLEPGIYYVAVMHDGERADGRIIEVK